MRLNNKELKGGFETKNLHYLSVWWLNNQSFGAARLMREITDAWIAQKWEIGGIRFSNDPPELSQIELDAIPGAKGALGSLDGVAWEVLERNGDQMVIRKDEDRYWSMQDGSIGDTFKGLKEKHNELIGRTNVTATSSAGAAPASATASTEAEGSGDGGQPTPASAVMVESIAKLEEMHGIETRSASEVANTELLMCKDGSLWLVATQGDKLVAKHTVLGGFGTGQWVPEADAPDTSVSFAMPLGDQSVVQLDEGSFSAQGQGVSSLTLYALLLRAEKEKGINEHKLSFLTVERKGDQSVEAGNDAFDVKVKTAMSFKFVKDPRPGQEDKVNQKNFFSKAAGCTRNSDLIAVVNRFRFERVGQSFKVQRPYCLVLKAIQLKKGQPYKLTK